MVSTDTIPPAEIQRSGGEGSREAPGAFHALEKLESEKGIMLVRGCWTPNVSDVLESEAGCQGSKLGSMTPGQEAWSPSARIFTAFQNGGLYRVVRKFGEFFCARWVERY